MYFRTLLRTVSLNSNDLKFLLTIPTQGWPKHSKADRPGMTYAWGPCQECKTGIAHLSSPSSFWGNMSSFVLGSYVAAHIQSGKSKYLVVNIYIGYIWLLIDVNLSCLNIHSGGRRSLPSFIAALDNPCDYNGQTDWLGVSVCIEERRYYIYIPVEKWDALEHLVSVPMSSHAVQAKKKVTEV